MKRFLCTLMFLVVAACGGADVAAPPPSSSTAPPPTIAPGPAAEEIGLERAHAVRASRSRQRQADLDALRAAEARAKEQARIAAQKLAAPKPLPPASIDDAFWRRLANCESADGTGGNGGGYFQFSPDTAKKVGYRPGLSYGEQLAMAKEWLRRIKGRGGSTSGWPHCWWVALRGG